jgi:hypothetical protein
MKKQMNFSKCVLILGLALGLVFSFVIIQPLFGSQFTIFALPVDSGGSLGTCPGAFCGYVNYIKVPPGWGWSPATNTTTFTASNGGGRSDVRIQFSGQYGDSGCNLSSVSIPNPPSSPQYIFYIYFRSSPPPTTNYPIILTGFTTN